MFLNVFHYYPTTFQEKQKDISGLHAKHTVVPGKPNFHQFLTKLLPTNATIILTNDLNKLISTSTFVSRFKKFKVIQLFKKRSRKLIEINYCPTRCLLFIVLNFSKQKNVNNQSVILLLHQNKHFLNFQFRFRKTINYYRTLILTSKITEFLNSKLKALCIFHDLLKAFDIFEHTILLLKLLHYGRRGIPLQD